MLESSSSHIVQYLYVFLGSLQPWNKKEHYVNFDTSSSGDFKPEYGISAQTFVCRYILQHLIGQKRGRLTNNTVRSVEIQQSRQNSLSCLIKGGGGGVAPT